MTYEQRAALFHAEWAASDNRNGYPTDSDVFAVLKDAIAELPAFEKYPELAAKMAELMPLSEIEIKAVTTHEFAFREVDQDEAHAMLDFLVGLVMISEVWRSYA